MPGAPLKRRVTPFDGSSPLGESPPQSWQQPRTDREGLRGEGPRSLEKGGCTARQNKEGPKKKIATPKRAELPAARCVCNVRVKSGDRAGRTMAACQGSDFPRFSQLSGNILLSLCCAPSQDPRKLRPPGGRPK
ncbi:hypothetical protein MRX96_004448 [Rhipicephalus microplus]